MKANEGLVMGRAARAPTWKPSPESKYIRKRPLRVSVFMDFIAKVFAATPGLNGIPITSRQLTASTGTPRRGTRQATLDAAAMQADKGNFPVIRRAGMTTITLRDIAEAIAAKEFRLYYQPKYSLITSRIVGAEALVRWHRRDGSVLPPASFIGLAERTGLIKDLTLQLLPQLVGDLAHAGLGTGLCVSFNVTAQDFEDDDLTEAVLYAISHQDVSPASLELEITETQALEAGACVLQRIQSLTCAGVGLAMDDYGIGYSSMDTLSQWPFTTIKLDQGIVGRMLDSKKNATIVRSSIRLGHELGLNVVAEGVEAVSQYDFLVEAGCSLIQGFLVSPALPLDDFLSLRRRAADCPGFPIGLVHMAIVDHVQWRRQMASFAIQRANLPWDSAIRQTDGYPELCLTRCALGRWYYDEGRYFATTSMYKALDAPHRALHAVGDAIVAKVRAGASMADIAHLLQSLKIASTSLIALLEDIEDIALQALYGEMAGGCYPLGRRPAPPPGIRPERDRN